MSSPVRGSARIGKKPVVVAVLLIIAGGWLQMARHGTPGEAQIEQWIEQASGVPRWPPVPGGIRESKEAAALLRFWQVRAEPLLIKRLRARDGRLSATWAKIQPRAPLFLARRLPRPRPASSIRQSAVLAIGAQGTLSPGLENALVEQAKDPDPIVRTYIAVVIGFKGSPSTVTRETFKRLINDPLVGQRIWWAMSSNPAFPAKSSTVAGWIADLDRPFQEARYQAVQALAKCETSPGLILPALIHVLDDPSETIGNAAARALGRCGPIASNALPTLRMRLASDTRITREIARAAINSIAIENQSIESKR